jgi:hypothetical protein
VASQWGLHQLHLIMCKVVNTGSRIGTE